MSKRNEAVNRIYQGSSPVRFLNAIQRRAFRYALERAYDAGKAHAAEPDITDDCD